MIRILMVFMLLAVLSPALILPAEASACGTSVNFSIINPTSVSLNAMVTSVGLAPPGVEVTFEWGTQPGVYPYASPVISVLTPGPVSYTVTGLIPGLIYYYRVHFFETGYCDVYSNPQQFKTQRINTSYGSSQLLTPSPAISPALIAVKTAAVKSTRVGVGDPVTVDATVANTGGVNGSSRITVYVNGQETASQGVVLTSGEIRNLSFTVNGNQPGTYTVRVNNQPAGSFTVDYFTNNDILIYGLIGLFAVATAGVLFLVARKRTG